MEIERKGKETRKRKRKHEQRREKKQEKRTKRDTTKKKEKTALNFASPRLIDEEATSATALVSCSVVTPRTRHAIRILWMSLFRAQSVAADARKETMQIPKGSERDRRTQTSTAGVADLIQ